MNKIISTIAVVVLISVCSVCSAEFRKYYSAQGNTYSIDYTTVKNRSGYKYAWTYWKFADPSKFGAASWKMQVKADCKNEQLWALDTVYLDINDQIVGTEIKPEKLTILPGTANEATYIELCKK